MIRENIPDTEKNNPKNKQSFAVFWKITLEKKYSTFISCVNPIFTHVV